MVKLILIVGGVAAAALLLISLIGGLDGADRYGRIAMPGERAIELDEGDYDVYYEERVTTSGNTVFEPPDGIRIRARGLGDAPDPELDLGGLGNQIGTDGRTAESIGTLRVSEAGRYGVVVGPPPFAASGPAITIGEDVGDSLGRGAKQAGIAAGAAGLLALLVLGLRKARRSDEIPAATGARFASAASSHVVPSSQAATPATAPPPAQVTAPRATPLTGDTLASLEQLGELRRSGALSEEEFQRLKSQLLG